MRDKLFKLIVRKEFRKWKLRDDAEKRIKTAVDLAVSEQKPLKFVFEFGGYKLWRLPSAPYADDAEIFMLRHYIAYLKPMAELYSPGVDLFFASDDYVVPRMNNISRDALDKYAASFKKSIVTVKPITPSNMNVSFVSLAGLYDDHSVLERELAETFADNLKKYENWPPEKKDRMRGRAVLNFCKSGPFAQEDLSGMTDGEYETRLLHGAVYHDAFEDCEKRRSFVAGKDSILLFCTPIPEAVAIGTTKASVTKFWTGVGIMEEGRETVLSPSRWEEKQK